MARRAHEKGLELIDYLLEKAYQRPFTDVITKDWYFKASQYAYEQGFMSGVDDGIFDPNSTMSRAMMMQTLYAMSGKPEAEGAHYDDVSDGDWFADAVNWAAGQGITAGLGGESFEPNTAINREQLARVLYLYAGSPKAELELTFADLDSISADCLDAVRWAVEAGVIAGMEDNTMNPQGLSPVRRPPRC